MARLLEALTCSYSGALRLVGEGSYLARSPLVCQFPFEIWCLSIGIAVPFSCRSCESRICVALIKRRFTRPLRELQCCFSSFVCSSLFIFIFVFPSVLCFFLSFGSSFVPCSTLLSRHLRVFLYIFFSLLQFVIH